MVGFWATPDGDDGNNATGPLHGPSKGREWHNDAGAGWSEGTGPEPQKAAKTRWKGNEWARALRSGPKEGSDCCRRHTNGNVLGATVVRRLRGKKRRKKRRKGANSCKGNSRARGGQAIELERLEPQELLDLGEMLIPCIRRRSRSRMIWGWCWLHAIWQAERAGTPLLVRTPT